MRKLPLKVEEFEALGCRLLIKYERPREKLASGLWLPEELRDDAETYEGVGIVRLKGDGRDLSWKTAAFPRSVVSMWQEVAVGDRVMFRKFLKDLNNINDMFIEHIIDEEGEFFILDIEDILMVIPHDMPVGMAKTSGTTCYSDGKSG